MALSCRHCLEPGIQTKLVGLTVLIGVIVRFASILTKTIDGIVGAVAGHLSLSTVKSDCATVMRVISG